MAPTVKLYYFDGRGRAEGIRWLLAMAGWKYEDIRVKQEDWPALKPKTPYGSLPYMIVDGTPLCQSLPIANYVAMEAGLMGVSKLQAAQCEMISANIGDAFNQYGSAMLATDEDVKKSGLEKLHHETLPKLFKFIMDRKGKNQYIIGNKLSLADIAVAAFLDNFDDDGRSEIKKHFPAIVELYHKVISLPRIDSWIKQRPKTSF